MSLIVVILIATAVGIGITKFVSPLIKGADVISEKGDYSQYYVNKAHKIVMFGTSTCPYCTKLRKLLSKQNVDYTEYVLDKNTDGRELFKQLGNNSVPVLLIGNTKINGFSESDTLKALQEFKLLIKES